MEKTGEGLCLYVEKKLGTPYFFGTKMQPLTDKFMQNMHMRHPTIVTDEYMQKARTKGLIGQICCDCSGLIEGYTGCSMGTAQLYASSRLRMSVSNLSVFPCGTVLWKKGHVAVFTGYINNIPYCIEARSLEYGCCISEIEGRGFTHGLLLKNILYASENLPGIEKIHNPYPLPQNALYFGAKGDSVKWLQHALNESGYTLPITGLFDTPTKEALISYQNTSDIYHEPGYLGFTTLQALKNTV